MPPGWPGASFGGLRVWGLNHGAVVFDTTLQRPQGEGCLPSPPKRTECVDQMNIGERILSIGDPRPPFPHTRLFRNLAVS